jgi:hypothetical protein
MYIQTYADDRVFSWDRRKSEANLADRGFDFEFASSIFSGPTLEREDTRQDYGERRIVAIGSADGILLVVAYTDRVLSDGRTERRLISARRASKRERVAYETAIEGKVSESRSGRP